MTLKILSRGKRMVQEALKKNRESVNTNIDENINSEVKEYATLTIVSLENIFSSDQPSTSGLTEIPKHPDYHSSTDDELFGNVSDDDRTYHPEEENGNTTNSEDSLEPPEPCEEQITEREQHIIQDNQITEIEVNNAEKRSRLARKRKRDSMKWKRNVQNKLRMEGKPYKTQKGIAKRGKSVKDITCRCHYKCNTHFTKDQRAEILKDFLNIPSEELRWSYLAKHVKCIPRKRSYVSSDSRRKFTKTDNSPQLSSSVSKFFPFNFGYIK